MTQQNEVCPSIEILCRQGGHKALASFSTLLLFFSPIPHISSLHAFGGVSPQQSTQQSRNTGNGSSDESDIRALESGKPIRRELAGGQEHAYRIKLGADQFLKVIVEQQGIDVIALVSGPDGNRILEFDAESRLPGREEALLASEAAGEYRLAVQTRLKRAPAGSYEIRIEELRAATESDRALHKARLLFAESLKLVDEGKYDEARPLAERALETRERLLGADHQDVAASIQGLGVIHYYKSDYSKAESLYQRALAIRERALGPDHPHVAASLHSLSMVCSDRGDRAKAEELCQRALAIREKVLGPEHPDVAASLHLLGYVSSSKLGYEEEERLYQRALAIREKVLGPDHPDVTATLHNLANLYRSKGEYAKAEPFYKRALGIEEKALGPDHPDIAYTLNGLAILYWQKGDYAKAEPLYKRALAIREKSLGPEHPDVAQTLDNLAILYAVRGDFANAAPMFQRALAIREKVLGPEHRGVANSLNNLAELYYDMGDLAKPEPLYQRALVIWEKALGPEHDNVGNVVNNLANIYRDRGEYAKAEPLYQRSLAIREKKQGPEHPDVADSLNNIALLLRHRGEYAKAEALYNRALAIREKTLGPEHPHVADTLYGLSALHAAKGDIAQAIKFQSRANAIGERNLIHNLAIGSERQKLAYLALFTEQTDFTISLHSQAAPDDPRALDLAFTTVLRRKGRGLDAMADTIGAWRRHATPENQALLDQLAEARSSLATFTLKESASDEPDKYRARLKPFEEKVENLEAQLSARNPEFRAQAQPVTLAAIQALLPTGSALVEFAVFTPQDPRTGRNRPPRYLVYALAAKGAPKWADLGEVAIVDRAVDAWRQALRDPKRQDVMRLARAVNQKVMQPVRSLIENNRRLLIAPDGLLNLIPFAALVDEQNRCLVENYSISYLTSGRDLQRLQVEGESQSGPLVVAAPDFGKRIQIVATRKPKQNKDSAEEENQVKTDSAASAFRELYFPPLPHAAQEGETLRDLLPGATLITKRQASKTALSQFHRPSLLHIATHGFFLKDIKAPMTDSRGYQVFNENPERFVKRLEREGLRIENPLLRSGLALAGANENNEKDDGILTALEVTGLNLWGTKLVALSACDTGVGEVKNGDGVHGLRRALVLAGAETQVMSLWAVSDKATRELMVSYYGRLKKGQGRGEALRQTQLEMLKQPNRRHPYYWASFIQSGEWANLDGKRDE
jgi:CHAT domain-containing protein/Tfp pilus assembly protein PilF